MTARLKGTIETLIGSTAAGLTSLVVTVDCPLGRGNGIAWLYAIVHTVKT